MATVNCLLRREMSRSRQIMQRMILIDQLVGKWIGSRLQRALKSCSKMNRKCSTDLPSLRAIRCTVTWFVADEASASKRAPVGAAEGAAAEAVTLGRAAPPAPVVDAP